MRHDELYVADLVDSTRAVWQISREEMPVLEEQAMDIMRAEFPETYERETVVEPGPDDTAEPGQEQTA
jgi:hypothetical protein